MSHPFFGKEFTFTQPDGSRLRVRGWGDQHYAVFETLDGYTVVRDPATGSFHYANVTSHRDELVPTGVRPGAITAELLNVSKGLRVNAYAARTAASISTSLPKPRWQERREAVKTAIHALSAGAVLPAPPHRHTVGNYVGLCLIVQFPDVAAVVSQAQVDAFCNEHGYTGFGNNGSVFDFYKDNSVGRLLYTTIVAPVYMAAHPRAYYTDPNVPYGQRTRELIKEALTFHLGAGVDFSKLTTDNGGFVFATNVFYAGDVVNNWGEGLWPHASRLTSGFRLAPGKSALDYQITNLGSGLELGTYCHENGHMLCDFPDLYEYSNQAAGDGTYCLMCLGGNANPINPVQVCAYLKYRAGWGNPVTTINPGLHGNVAAGSNQFYVFQRNATEYFILENREQAGRDSALSDSGLAIWHIDELGSNSDPQSSPTGHQRFECSLVQADGRDELGQGINQGDASDLFRAGFNAEFGAGTNPSSTWFDGTPSNLNLRNISQAGSNMTFEAV